MRMIRLKLGNLLLPILVVLVSLVLLTEAGMFDFLKNKKDKQDNYGVDEPDSSEQTVDSETVVLAQELNQMDGAHEKAKVGRDISKIVEAAEAVAEAKNSGDTNEGAKRRVYHSHLRFDSVPETELMSRAERRRLKIQRQMEAQQELDAANLEIETSVLPPVEQQVVEPEPEVVAPRRTHKKENGHVSKDGKWKPSQKIVVAVPNTDGKPPVQVQKQNDYVSKLTSTDYWGKKMKGAYKTTKKGLKNTGTAIAHTANKASVSIQTMLQLTTRGRLMPLITEAKQDMHYIQTEFSKFSIEWSPRMENSIHYNGLENLERIKKARNDELDHSEDCLLSTVFGYEFMRLMMAWRENIYVAHEGYKYYLENAVDSTDEQGNPIEADDNFLFRMRTVHEFFLLEAWKTFNITTAETKMKLEYLMKEADDGPKRYESPCFLGTTVLQEYYEVIKDGLMDQYNQISHNVVFLGIEEENFAHEDAFFKEFREALAGDQIEDSHWEVPKTLVEFMDRLKPMILYNPVIYSRDFLQEIRVAKETALKRLQGDL